MKVNIAVIVLGNYLPLQKYLGEIPMLYEKYVSKQGDLFNIKLRHSEKTEVEAVGEDINTEVLTTDLKLETAEQEDMFLSCLFGDNPCRCASKDDIFGLYSNSSVTIKTPKLPEDFEIDIYYNYFLKTEDCEVPPDYMYIFDNADTGLSTYGTIEYLIDKYKVDTFIYTYHNSNDYLANLRSTFKDEVEIEVNKFDF